MVHVIIHHLNAHRVSSEDLPNSETDRFLLEDTHTESDTYNIDGTKRWFHSILAHGTREDVEEKIEGTIEMGMDSYRSRMRGDDYFRAGVQNALDDATPMTDATAKRIRVRLGCTINSDDSDEIRDRKRKLMDEIRAGEPWEQFEEESEMVKGTAYATSRAMDGVAQVNAILDGEEETSAFRNFEVLEEPP